MSSEQRERALTESQRLKAQPETPKPVITAQDETRVAVSTVVEQKEVLKPMTLRKGASDEEVQLFVSSSRPGQKIYIAGRLPCLFEEMVPIWDNDYPNGKVINAQPLQPARKNEFYILWPHLYGVTNFPQGPEMKFLKKDEIIQLMSGSLLWKDGTQRIEFLRHQDFTIHYAEVDETGVRTGPPKQLMEWCMVMTREPFETEVKPS